MASKKEVVSENINPYFEVSLDTFLFNAGIIGFIQVLETLKAKEGKDYIIKGQVLKVSKAFLSDTDLAQGYIDAVCKKFGEKTKIYNTIENIKYLINNKDIYKKLDKETKNLQTEPLTENSIKTNSKKKEKKEKSRLDNIIDSLTAASIKTGCATMNANGLKNSIQHNIEKIDKTNGKPDSTLILLKNILSDLEKDEIKKTLFMKNIIYTKIKLFWDGVSFLNKQNASNKVKDEFYKSFELPLKDVVKNTKEEKYRCITCGVNTSNKISTSFLFEVGIDANRKKSAFWNQTPDAFLCPLCNFIYSCSPLGFIDMSSNMIFVNQNDSIETLKNMNATIEFLDNDKNKKYNFYNTIIQRALSIKTKELSSIQIINRNEKHYSSNIIGEDILHIIKTREKELKILSGIYIKDRSDNYIDVFDECLKNIFNNTNQWDLMFILLKSDIKSFNFIFLILKIQITQKYNNSEGKNVDNKINYSIFASRAGNELRNKLGSMGDKEIDATRDSENASTDADNKLRGLVYQLVNSVHTGNTDLFFSIVTRLYTSLNLTIPTVFMDIFKGDENFKEIGYAYIIGIKGGYYSSKEKEENK